MIWLVNAQYSIFSILWIIGIYQYIHYTCRQHQHQSASKLMEKTKWATSVTAFINDIVRIPFWQSMIVTGVCIWCDLHKYCKSLHQCQCSRCVTNWCYKYRTDCWFCPNVCWTSQLQLSCIQWWVFPWQWYVCNFDDY